MYNSNCNPCNGSPFSFHKTNYFNVNNYPCNPCDDTPKCNKEIPAYCTIYNGKNLSSLGLTTNIRIELILEVLNDYLKSLDDTITELNNKIENTRSSVLTIVNDINSRLNVLEDSNHPPYQL